MKKGLGLYQDLFFVLVKPAVYFFVAQALAQVQG
jgi:hypothetical protein